MGKLQGGLSQTQANLWERCHWQYRCWCWRERESGHWVVKLYYKQLTIHVEWIWMTAVGHWRHWDEAGQSVVVQSTSSASSSCLPVEMARNGVKINTFPCNVIAPATMESFVCYTKTHLHTHLRSDTPSSKIAMRCKCCIRGWPGTMAIIIIIVMMSDISCECVMSNIYLIWMETTSKMDIRTCQAKYDRVGRTDIPHWYSSRLVSIYVK